MRTACIWFTRASTLLTLITVSLGSVVCATRSGFDCHSWPGCYDDRFVPGSQDIPAILVANPALEMVHRVIAMSTGGVLIATAVLVTLLAGPTRPQKLLTWVACAGAGVSALVGRAAVLGQDVHVSVAALDLLCALVTMSVSLYVAVAVSRSARYVRGRLGDSALLAAVLLTVTFVSGLFAAGDRSFTRCVSWPLLWLASDDNIVLQTARTAVAILAIMAVIVTVRVAHRSERERLLGRVLTALAVLSVVLGVIYRAAEIDGGVVGIAFSVTCVAVLWTTVLIAARSTLPSPIDPAQPRPSNPTQLRQTATEPVLHPNAASDASRAE